MIKRKRLFLMAAVVLVLAGTTAQARPQDELIQNEGFERGDVAWRYWGDGDVREDYYGVSPRNGDFFLRIWSRSGWYQDFEVKKGERFDVSVFAASASQHGLWGDAFGELKVEWRNEKNGEDFEVGESSSVMFDMVGKQNETLTADEWTQISLRTLPAPEQATHGRVLVAIWAEGDPKGGGCALFDDISVRKAR